MLDDLSSQDLQRVIMRSKVLFEKKQKEEAELREQERIRQERLELERKRQEEIAELQRKIQELQNQKIEVPEEPCKAKGDGFVMYDTAVPGPSVKTEAPIPPEPEKTPEPAQIICPRCGEANTAGSGFCLKCGNKLSKPEPKVSAPQEPAQIICPRCGEANTAGSGFCLKCGNKLSKPEPEPKVSAPQEPAQIICPRCGEANPADSAFCLKCGHKLSGPKPEPEVFSAPAPKPERTPEQVCYADESMKKWEMLPGEKVIKNSHETVILQPETDKKSVYYMEITDRRILFSKESAFSKNAKVAMGVGGGLVGAIIAEGVSAASGNGGVKPYLAIPLSAVTDCGLRNKKEFFIAAGQTFVFKNHGYENIVPDLVRKAKNL